MDDQISRSSVIELEDVAARAVPAAEVVELGGWVLRATPGLPTKRANSVLARAGSDARIQLSERLTAAEKFYAGHGLPARFQLSPASAPDGLADALHARGYRASAPVDVQAAGLGDAAAPAIPGGLRVDISATASDAWWSTWSTAVGVDTERVAAVAILFGRITGETGFASARGRDGQVISVGMGVRDRDWVGLFNMATLPGHRGLGAGRAVVRAIAEWGRARGARRVYLQVETDNGPARSLYRRAGFRPVYAYSYLTQSRI
jgi:GNAT superfamily N-acetyltransferase